MEPDVFQWQRDLDTRPGLVAWIGYVAIALAVISFGYWAVTAPIDGAAIAPGAIAAAEHNIQLQHLEGGVVRDIRVREGDKIVRGQVLMLLDATAAQAQLNRHVKQWVALSARISRLEAERDGSQFLQIDFKKLSPDDQVEIVETVADEVKEFDARLIGYRSELQILSQRLSRLNEAIVGVDAQRAAVVAQTIIVDSEVTRKRGLVEQGLTNRSEYADLLRMQADLLGQSGALSAEKTATQAQIGEAQEQIERLAKQRVEEALASLNEARANLADVQEQIAAARAVLTRTVVRSPVNGIVVTSLYNVIGNVISPGERIMEIFPTADDPLIEARLKTTDIDVVHLGQTARIRLVALNSRTTPEVSAIVQYISADRLIDKETKDAYFRILLRTSEGVGSFRLSRVKFYAGMPVEVLINTGERTFLEYLIKPFRDSLSRAFVEE